LYPQVFDEFFQHYDQFGVVRTLPTAAFFFGLKENEEILIELGEGKNLLVQYINCSKPDSLGEVMVYFKLNGQSRVIPVFDKSSKVERKVRKKAEKVTQIGSPLQGSLASILVEAGQKVEVNEPLFVIEAMKMESTITAPMAGEISKIYLLAKDMVDQDDLVVEIDPVKELI
jgi:pyruvate carboxylase